MFSRYFLIKIIIFFQILGNLLKTGPIDIGKCEIMPLKTTVKCEKYHLKYNGKCDIL